MTVTINGFVIDAALHETHTYESEVTEYPVESGVMITDNIRPKPKTVEIDGIVSDTPLPGVIANARGADSNGNLNSIPSDDALAALEAIYIAREPVTIETSLKRYDNMSMTNLVIPRDAETGYALSFTASFQEVQYVTNDRATIKVSPPLSTGLGAKKDLGNKVVFYTGKDLVLWHHSEPKPVFSTSEQLGVKMSDVSKGQSGLYHPNGQPLTDDELDQYNADEKLWFQTHNDKGEEVTDPNSTDGFPGGFGDPSGTEATFQNSDGTWVDSEGRPVTQNPNYGNWTKDDLF